MLRLTLSTAVAAPKLLLTPSIRICAVAPGSSHGRSASGLDCEAIMTLAAPKSEIRWRCRAAPRWCVKRPLDDPRPHDAPLPHQLAGEIDVGPHRGAGGTVRRVDHGEREVLLGRG